jgi:chorismate mutase/prephenate dehydratase
VAPDDASTDPLVKQIREEISDNDRAIVDAINKRLKLVTRLKAYKAERGYDFVDPEREEWMLTYLDRANRGPLSAEGLRELFAQLLALTKKEVS